MAVNLEQRVKTSFTSELVMPSVSTENYDVVSKLERRLKAFLKNPEWIYETLSLIDKAQKNFLNLNEYELWALRRLDLNYEIQNNNLVVSDRYNNVLSQSQLSSLKSKIISLTVNHASKVLKDTSLHHMEESFKRVLRKAISKELNQEEVSILKDAYLKVENGKVVNLKGNQVKLPRLGFLTFFGF